VTGADAGGTDPGGAERSVRAIAFDWGGVFTEGTFDGRAVAALADLFGVDEATVAAHYYPLMESFEVGAFGLKEFARRLQDAVAVQVDDHALQTTFLGAARERAAMYDLLAGIPDTLRVAMLSNNVPELCDGVRSDARMARIERFVFSNEIGVRKPDPAAFAALAEALGVPPQATVFIDDNPANVAACTSLGFRGLLLDSASGFARRWRSTVPELGHLVDGAAWRA
jgi:HAD superfamily hydrolase (TIGR01509 family)